jgi:hypothetical protein
MSKISNPTNHMRLPDGRRFYLAVHGRRVSVRCLHPDWVVQLRGMSGSFARWRSSGDFETFREQGAAILVADSH